MKEKGQNVNRFSFQLIQHFYLSIFLIQQIGSYGACDLLFAVSRNSHIKHKYQCDSPMLTQW